MNFYILTFKKKIIISFLLIFSGIIILDVILYLYADMKTSKITYKGNKFNKLKHFTLNNPINKDMIFIGSSKTIFHISTNQFKEKDIEVFNLGISGAQYEDYPSLISEVVKFKPKKIVISLSINRFYDKLKIPKLPAIEELFIYYNIDKIRFIHSIMKWIENKHTFLTYSEIIFLKIKSFYNKFNNSTDIKHINTNNTDYKSLADCKVFDIQYRDNNGAVMKCTNGDGILVGNNLETSTLIDTQLITIDKESILYLKNIIQNIKSKDIQPIIILEPILNNKYQYNLNDIKKYFSGIELIDFTNLQIKNKYWSDNSHLNYLGREKYTQVLIDTLGERNE